MLKKMRLKTKLIALFLMAGIVPFALISLISVIIASNALKKKAFDSLEAVRGIKKEQIKSFFEDRQKDVVELSKIHDVYMMFKVLRQYHTDTNVTATSAYDVKTPAYQKLYNENSGHLNNYVRDYGYYDMLIICGKHGHVMYTAARESDLGTNLVYGPYKNSGLAELWQKVMQTKGFVIQDFAPYAPSNNQPAAFIGAPIKKDGKILGVVVLQLSLDAINKIMQQRDGMGKTGETYLVGSDKLMRSDSYLDPTHHAVIASFANPDKGKVDTEATREALSGKTDSRIITDYLGNPVLSAFSSFKLGDTVWAIIAEMDEAEAFADIQTLEYIMYTIAAVLAAIVLMVAFFVARSITQPILKAVEFSKEMARGDFSQSVTIKQEDEIGEMVGALNSMSGNLAEMIRDINDNSISLEASSTELSAIANQISASSDSTVERSNSVASAAEEMNVNMNSVASAMEEATGNVDTVASASEEMNASIAGIVKDVDAAKESTDDAVTRADEVSENVKTLGRDAEEIGTVTETIAAISEKTNLLALNATIEAARAGDAGKGFAVVANEIKELANQTATATTDIGQKLKRIQGSTGVAISGVEEIAGTVKSINEIVLSVRETMTQQRGATQEITENINQASLGLKEINQNVSQTSEAAGQVASEISEVNESANEMSSSNAQLNQSAEELSKMASQLKEKIEQFKV